MKKLLAILTLSALATTAHADATDADSCEFWYETAYQIFQARQNNAPMPRMMRDIGSIHSEAERLVQRAYHPVWGMPAMSETGKEQASLQFANEAAEHCYRKGVPAK